MKNILSSFRTKISHLKKESKNIILFLVLKGKPRVSCEEKNSDFAFLLLHLPPRFSARDERMRK